ncbi:hypothetical protein HY972_02235 [Candidatus Kaiserbacteria bacterium]|nr:hypothetical protein [Candidatus Kaiserbacteria bacterium]
MNVKILAAFTVSLFLAASPASAQMSGSASSTSTPPQVKSAVVVADVNVTDVAVTKKMGQSQGRLLSRGEWASKTTSGTEWSSTTASKLPLK